MGRARIPASRLRRVSRELAVLHPENPKGWELLCRSFRGLEKADSAGAEFYRREAAQALQKALELHKGDRSKLPPDLSSGETELKIEK